MPTLQRTAAVLTFPVIAWLAVSCDMPTEPRPADVQPTVEVTYATPTRWVNDDDPNGGGYDPPGTSCTDPGYPTIQEAVNAAAPAGETIQVCAGTYLEPATGPLTIHKTLTLLGEQVGED